MAIDVRTITYVFSFRFFILRFFDPHLQHPRKYLEPKYLVNQRARFLWHAGDTCAACLTVAGSVAETGIDLDSDTNRGIGAYRDPNVMTTQDLRSFTTFASRRGMTYVRRVATKRLASR